MLFSLTNPITIIKIPHPPCLKNHLRYLRSQQLQCIISPCQTVNPSQKTYFPTTNIPLDPIPVAVPFAFLVLGLPCIAPLPLAVASPFIFGEALPFSLTGELLTILFRRLRLPSGMEESPSSWTTTISVCCFAGAACDGGAMYVPDRRSPAISSCNCRKVQKVKNGCEKFALIPYV